MTAWFAACGAPGADRTATFPALGTLVTIDIRDADPNAADRAIDAIDAYYRRIGTDWYEWGDGELGRIDAALARGDPAPVSAELAQPIGSALAMRDASDGYFDPVIGDLVQMWGFDNSHPGVRAPPPEARLDAWLAAAPVRASLRLESGRLAADGPVQLALGGILKGTALNAAVRIMMAHGIEDALIDAGGDVSALGSHSGRPWRIGVRDPRSEGIVGVIELTGGESVMSSGDYERFYIVDGRRYHHLLDPHTAWPVAHTAGVTVVDTDAELADAAATALMAAGPGHFDALAAQMGVVAALLIDSDGRIMMTPGMRKRFKPKPGRDQGR